MAKFKLICGTFDDGQGMYSAGDVVESAIDLREVFVNKFSLVEAPMPDATAHPLPPQPTAAKKAEELPSAADPVPLAVEPGDKARQGQNSQLKSAEDLGKEVTKLFPKAIDEDFRVFKRANRYWVYDDDLVNPIHKAGLVKSMVEKTIQLHLE